MNKHIKNYLFYNVILLTLLVTVQLIQGFSDVYALAGEKNTIGSKKEIALVLDASMSITGERATTLKKSALDFLAKLYENNANAKIAIIPFNDTANKASELLSLKENYKNLTEKISNIKFSGKSNLGDGMRRAYWKLKKGEPDAEKHMLIMTDGLPTLYTSTVRHGMDIPSKYLEFITDYMTQTSFGKTNPNFMIKNGNAMFLGEGIHSMEKTVTNDALSPLGIKNAVSNRAEAYCEKIGQLIAKDKIKTHIVAFDFNNAAIALKEGKSFINNLGKICNADKVNFNKYLNDAKSLNPTIKNKSTFSDKYFYDATNLKLLAESFIKIADRIIKSTGNLTIPSVYTKQ